MTYKQQVFVSKYLKCLNATEAARRAGYNGNDVTLAAVGYENLRKPQIRAALDSHLKALHVSADMVLARLTEMANVNVADFLDDTGHLNLEMVKDKGYLIKKFKTKSRLDQTGTNREPVIVEEIEVCDALKALFNIGKHLGLFKAATRIDDRFVDAIEEAGKRFVAPERMADYLRFVGEAVGNSRQS